MIKLFLVWLAFGCVLPSCSAQKPIPQTEKPSKPALTADREATSKTAQSNTKNSQADEDSENSEPKLTALGTFKDKEISESSGVVYASLPQHPGAIWTINDSGHKPILFLVGRTGEALGKIKLENARNQDWEAMCEFEWGGKKHLAIADVGDNSFNRKSYQLIFIEEPSAKANSQKTKTYDFKFAGKPLNCEAVGFNSLSRDFWFVEKVYVDGKKTEAPGIYKLALSDLIANQEPEKNARAMPLPIAKKIGEFPVRNVTGMTFSPDNRRLVIRTYFLAFLFERVGDKSWEETVNETKPKTLPVPIQTQGEAICFADDSNSLILTSERAKSTIWKVEIDGEKSDSDK